MAGRRTLTPSAIAVLPDRARADERLLQLTREGGLAAGRLVWTLAELERELVRAAVSSGACPKVAPPQALRLALQAAARDLTPPGSPFASLREEPAYARALGELLGALAQGLCDPEQLLSRLGELPPPARERAAALGRTLSGARAELRASKLIDQHRALWTAVDALERGLALPEELRDKQRIDFEELFDWTPLRQRLAVAIAAKLPRGAVRVHLPWAAGRPQLTEALEPTLRAFEALGGAALPGAARLEVVLHEPTDRAPFGPSLRHLFSRQAAPMADERLQLRSCATPAAQAREAARACADLAARGVALSSIAVAARSLAGGVAEELGAALDRFSVPWRERRGRPALPAQPARVALSVYQLGERNFPREELIALLSSPLLRLGEPADRVPPHRLARRLREARVRDDAADDPPAPEGGIAQKLQRLEERLRRKALLRSRDDRDAAEVARVRAVTEKAVAAIRQLPVRVPIADHARALLRLLAAWGVPEAVHRAPWSSPAASSAAARDLAALGAVERICAGLTQAAQLLRRAREPIDREQFAGLLREALADESLPAPGARGAAVQLCELRELAGRSFSHLVVVGLVDGELPARPGPDALLSDEEKRAWNRAVGKPVFRTPAPEPPQPEAPLLLPSRQAEEPLLFLLGLCAARESVLLLRPRTDAQGRELVRSPFADELTRSLALHEERAALSPIPLPRDCRTGPELLARASLEAFAAPAFRITPPLPEAEALPLLSALLRSPLALRLPRLTRAAAAERDRLRAFAQEAEPGRFAGRLQGAALAAALPSLAFGAEAPLSASQLEQHGTCGFKLLAHKLLGVPDLDQHSDELPPRERGELLHRCLQAFYARLQREGRLPLRAAHRQAELQTLAEETDAAMDAFALEQAVGDAALWKLRRAELHLRLSRLIDADRQQEGVPRYLEQGFGGAGELPALRIASPDGKAEVQVLGRIDRIDELPGNRLLVLDYKSGGVEGLRKKLRGETLCKPEFQLALYAAALSQARPGAQVDAAYVSIKSASRPGSLRKACAEAPALLELDPAERARLRQRQPPPVNLADEVWNRVDAMRAGRFPIAPSTCENCDLETACRVVALPVEEDE